MKLLAIGIGVLIIVVGMIGLVHPTTLLAIGQTAITPMGLYIITGLRVGIGLVLLLAAAASRMPRTVRAAGAVIVLAGIATPFFGVDRSRAVLDWLTAHHGLLRIDALLASALGVFMVYAIGPLGHRSPSLPAPR
jgi:hypothetical protein